MCPVSLSTLTNEEAEMMELTQEGARGRNQGTEVHTQPLLPHSLSRGQCALGLRAQS